MSDVSGMSRAESIRKHQQLKDKIRSRAKSSPATNDLLQYKLVFECFLKRLFSGSDGTWAVKGGAALLLRGSGSRTTTDIDLVKKNGLSVGQIEDELRVAAGRDADDDFNFEILKLEEKRKPDGSGYKGATYKATVIARIGLREFKKFSLDITEHRHTQKPLEEVVVRSLLKDRSQTKSARCVRCMRLV